MPFVSDDGDLPLSKLVGSAMLAAKSQVSGGERRLMAEGLLRRCGNAGMGLSCQLGCEGRKCEMRQVIRSFRFAAALGIGWGAASLPTPAHALYVLQQTIPVPATSANQLGGAFTSYDISFFDSTPTGVFAYIADRTNAAIDVIKGAPASPPPSFVGKIFPPGSNAFAGLAPPLPAGTSALSGPDGIVVVDRTGQHQVWAGDAPVGGASNSPLKGFDLSGFTGTGATLPQTPAFTVNTGGNRRVDEGSYDPKDNILLFANNAETNTNARFGTLVNASTGAKLGQLFTNGAAGQLPAGAGLEQPTWIGQGINRFFLNVDTASGPGGIAAIVPLANGGAGTVTQFYDFSTIARAPGVPAITACSPTGLDHQGTLLVANCGTPGPVIVLDPTANGGNGQIIATFSAVTGGDELWCDQGTKRCFVTGLTNGADTSTRAIAVLDFSGATPQVIQVFPTSFGAHSVASDPLTGDVYVPFGGGEANPESVCPNGCIAVFADVAAVPEPVSSSLMLTALAGLGLVSLFWRRHRQL